MIDKYSLIKVIMEIIRYNDEFSIRETAKKIETSPSATKYALDFLLKEGILEKRILGRNHLFRVKNTFLTKHIKMLYSLSEINSSGIIEELTKKDKDAMSIIIYGSVARGEDDYKSDIDIMIISRKKINTANLNKEIVLKREINIANYTYSEWKKKAVSDKAFYNNVILNCIVLFGEKPVVV